MKRPRTRGAWRQAGRRFAALAAAIAWLTAAGGQAAAQIAATSPAMAAVTVPPASAEPPQPQSQPQPPPPLPPLDTSGPAVDERSWPSELGPAPPPPADYRADLFDETQPDAAESDFPAPLLQPPARTGTPASPPSTPAPRTAPPATLPGGSGTLDSATTQRIIDRLVALHFLASPADAQNPDALTQAIRDFQASIGISPSGTMDRDTVGRLTLP